MFLRIKCESINRQSGKMFFYLPEDWYCNPLLVSSFVLLTPVFSLFESIVEDVAAVDDDVWWLIVELFCCSGGGGGGKDVIVVNGEYDVG